MSAQPPGIACSRLVVCRGDFRLGPLDLELAAGQIACLVGPNGSGKTTLLKTIMGLIPAVSGEAAVHGVSTRGRPPAVLRELGYAADGDEGLIGELTATELWDLHALVHTRRGGSLEQMRARARTLAQTLDFVAPATRVSALSHGMQKKTQLVAALLHEPSVLVLDEPRNGLDPLAIERLEQLVMREASAAKTVVIATHDLRFAERIADQVVILSRGAVLEAGRPSDICTDGDDLVETFFRLVDADRVET